jgi:hypothetical protein
VSGPRLQRVADQDRRLIEITVDGWAMSAMEGDTLLVAILAQRSYLREAIVELLKPRMEDHGWIDD